MSKKIIILSFAALLMATVAMAQQGSKEVKRTTVVTAKPTAQTTIAKSETKPVVRSAEYEKRAAERANHGRKESWGNQKAPFKK
jgi:ABC-type uncharacterized transport system substrate-binding protein